MLDNDYDYDNDNEPPRDFCTAPLGILRRVCNHTRPHRIQLHIAATGQQVGVGSDWTGFVPTLPKRSRSQFLSLDEPCLPTRQSFHQLPHLSH